MIRLHTPISDQDISRLKAGDIVYFNGIIYTGRDAAHQRLVNALEKGEELPID